MSTEAIKESLYRYWAIPLFAVWAGFLVWFNVIGQDPYGVEEQAARGLLLNWSVSDNIVNPIVTLGAPDFRALLFVPIGIYWPGNILAAKLFVLFVAFVAAMLLYKWTTNNSDQETGLIALVLFLVSPMLINQIDALGSGVFMLMCFALGNWLNTAYRAKPKVFGGWYFMQMLMIGIAVTMHPIGLALPAAIALHWWRNPDANKKSLHIYIGLVLAVLVSMAIKGSWDGLNWLSNPIMGLSGAIQGGVILGTEDNNLVIGILIAFVTIAVILIDKAFIFQDNLGLMLLLAMLIGLSTGDDAWASIVAALVIFRGIPVLVKANLAMNKTSFLGQRGIVVITAFIVTTLFMSQAKVHAYDHKRQILHPEDELIAKLANIAADERAPFRAASQWPGRTMLACRRDVLGLPPNVADNEKFHEMIKGLTHILFDPYAEKNQRLTNSLAFLSGETETLTVEKAGVIIKIRDHNVEVRDVRPKPKTEEENSRIEANGTGAQNTEK